MINYDKLSMIHNNSPTENFPDTRGNSLYSATVWGELKIGSTCPVHPAVCRSSRWAPSFGPCFSVGCGVQVYLHVISLEGNTIKYHFWDPESKCIHNSQLQPHLAKIKEPQRASSHKLPVPAIPSAPPCVISPSPRVLFLLNMSPENFTCFTFTWSQSQHGQNGPIFSPTKTWLTDAEDQPSTPASRFVSKRSCSFFAALMTDVGRLRSDPTILQLLSIF